MFDKVKNYGQVMTPDTIVNHMIDILNLTQKELSKCFRKRIKRN